MPFFASGTLAGPSPVPACRAERPRIMPETTKATSASPVTATPAHFSGEKTNDAAKSPMAVPIFQSISIAPVR